jgi:hypothetical protein
LPRRWVRHRGTVNSSLTLRPIGAGTPKLASFCQIRTWPPGFTVERRAVPRTIHQRAPAVAYCQLRGGSVRGRRASMDEPFVPLFTINRDRPQSARDPARPVHEPSSLFCLIGERVRARRFVGACVPRPPSPSCCAVSFNGLFNADRCAFLTRFAQFVQFA